MDRRNGEQTKRQVSIVTGPPEPEAYTLPFEKPAKTFEELRLKVEKLESQKSQLLKIVQESDRLFREYNKRHKACKPWMSKYQLCRQKIEKKRDELITQI